MLVELHEAPDPRALSRGKYRDTGIDHFALTLVNGVAARIDYKVVHGQRHRVEIIKFYKKNQT